MSTTIEERVLQMRFDNKQFESGAAESMSTLDKLKSKLDFTGAAKGLKDVGDAADQVSLTSLGNGVDSVAVKFDALAVVAITALSRITDQAISTGTQMVKSLSTDQIITGFNKYEQKLNSVQMIMNATGMAIEDVEEQLDKLIWFTDETSYSFSDMVNNISKFTANQVELDVATRAMMGIANAAGLAGVSVNDASHAMDGFSKAIAQGYMSRQNWQWIRTAHMDTAAFKQQLLDAAVAAGTLVKVGDDAYKTIAGTAVSIGDFETGMKDAWINTDVMIKTLEKFGGAAEDLYEYTSKTGKLTSDAIEEIGDSLDEIGIKAFKASQEYKTFADAISATKDAVSTGWMETFDIIFGNFEEAKELWTALGEELYEVFAEGGNARNEALEAWKEGGGRDLLLEGIGEAWMNLKEIVLTVKEAIAEVFPVDWVKLLNTITQGINDFGKSLKLSEESLTTIKEAVKLLTIPIQALVQVVRVGWSVFTNTVSILWTLVDVMLALPTKIGGVSGALEKLFGEERYQRLAEAFHTIVLKLADAFTGLVAHVKDAIAGFKGLSNTKLGETFKKLADILMPIGEWILDRIVDGIEMLANADYSKITDWAITGLSFVVDRLWDIKDVAGSAITSIIGFFQQLDRTSPAAFFTSISNSVTELKKNISSFVKNLGFTQIMTAIREETSGITEVISNLADAFASLIAKLTPAKILVFGFGVTLVGVMNNVSKAFAAFEGVAKSVTGMFTNVGGIFKAIQDRIKPNKLNQISWALLLLAGALVAMSLVDSEKLKAAVGAMAAMMTGLVAMTGAFALIQNKLLKGEDLTDTLKEIALVMIAVAGAVTILSAAMLMLQKVDFNSVIGPLAAVITTMVGLSLAIAVLAKYTKGDLPKNALTLVAFALAVKMIASTLEGLAAIDLSGAVGNIGVLIVALGMIRALSKMAEKISFKSALGLTVIVADLLLFAKVLQTLGKVDPASLLSGIVNYIGILTALLPLFWLSSLAGKEAQKMGVAMLTMSAAILLLQFAVKRIGELDVGQVIKGTAAVSALIAVFSLIMKASWLVSGDVGKIGKTFIAMSVAILLLSVAIQYLGGLSLKEAVQGGVVVSAILLIFAQITKAAGGLSKATGTIGALVAAIGMLTAAVMLLTLVDFNEAMQSVVILSSVMLAFGATMKLIQGIDVKNGLASVMVMGSIIGAFAMAFIVLKDIEPMQMLQSAVALSSVMLALGVTMKLINSMAGNAKVSLTSIAGTAAVLLAASGIMAVLNAIPFNEGILEKAASLSLIMLSISAVMAVLGNMKTSGNDSLKNAASFVIVTAAIAAIVAGIGALAIAFDKEGALADAGVSFMAKLTPLIPIILALAAVTWALSKVSTGMDAAGKGAVGFAKVALIVVGVIAGIGLIGAAIDAIGGEGSIERIMGAAQTVFYAVAEIIGGSLGRLISSFGTGITSGLAQMGADLSTFAEQIQPFLTAMRSVDQPVLDGVIKMVEMMTLLSANDFISNMLSFGTSDPLTKFGKQLVDFAPLFVEFANQLKDIPIEQTMAAGTCLTGLAELLAAIPAEGGLLQDLLGGRDFKKFGEGLVDFAAGFRDYCDVLATTTIDQSMVDATKCATDALIELANKVPKSGGALQAFFGENDIGKFGQQLYLFALGLRNFFNIISEASIDYELVKTCASAGSALAEFANKVPAAGGVLQEWFGAQDIGIFGGQLLAFGQALVGFFELFSGENAVKIDQSLVKACVDAGEAFASFSEKVPRMGSAFEWFTGKKDMGEFGEQISEFGSGLASFFEAFKGTTITEDDVKLANTAMEGFATLSQSIGRTGGFSNAWSSSKLSEYGEQIEKLGGYLEKYYNKIKQIDLDAVNASTTAVKGILGLQDGLKDSGFEINETVKQILNDMIASADTVLDNKNQYSGQFYTMGGYIVNGVEKGISDNTEGAVAGVADFGNALVDSFANSVGVQSPSTKFAEIGMYMVAGLKNGIEKNITVAKNAIIKMGQSLLSSIRNFFKIRSPSIVMRDEVGRYIIQGIAEGITEDMSAEEAATKKAQNIIAAFQAEFDKFNLDMTTADLEYNLWSGQNPNANEQDTKAQQIDMLTKKLQAQAERVNLANAQYQATLQQLGAESEKTQEAYNLYLQEQISMTELAAQMADARAVSDSSRALSTSTEELEFELWQKMNETATEEEIANQRTELLNRQLEVQATKVAMANAEYNRLLEELGAEADATKDAYEAYLQAQIDMADKASELAELRRGGEEALGDEAQNSAESFKEWAALLAENHDALANAGFSLDEIRDWATRQTGWNWRRVADESNIVDDVKTDVAGIVEEFMSKVGDSVTVIEGDVGQSITSIIDEFMSAASDALYDTSNGIGFVFTEAISSAVAAGTSAAGSGGGSVGDALTSGLSDSILGGEPDVTGALEDVLTAVTEQGITESEVAGMLGGQSWGNKLHEYLQKGGDTAVGWVDNFFAWLKGDTAEKAEDTAASAAEVAMSTAKEKMMHESGAVQDVAVEVVREAGESATTQASVSGASIGVALMAGAIDGMISRQRQVKDTAALLAKTAELGFRQQAEINSPSRVFYRLGQYIDQGLANGIMDDFDIVEGSVKYLTDGIQDASGDATISPVMDLDEWNSSYRKVRDDMDDFYGTILQWDASGELVPYGYNNTGLEGKWLKVDRATALAIRAGNAVMEAEAYRNANTGYANHDIDAALSSPTYNFTQNNYSPTPLSTAQIYKNTRNQFSKAKETYSDKTSGFQQKTGTQMSSATSKKIIM